MNSCSFSDVRKAYLFFFLLLLLLSLFSYTLFQKSFCQNTKIAMADFRYQWQQYLVFPHERDNIVMIFNIVLVDLASQAAPSTFTVFTFMVTILVAFIQIKFTTAGTSSISSPFETHHTKFMVAMLSLLAFCCFAIGAAQNYFPTVHAPKLRMAIKFTASLSVASLVSLLLPKPWDHVPYMIYVFYFIGHCLGLIRNICLPYYQHVSNGFVRTLRARQQQLRRTRPLLPVTASGPNISNQPIANHGSITQVGALS